MANGGVGILRGGQGNVSMSNSAFIAVRPLSIAISRNTVASDVRESRQGETEKAKGHALGAEKCLRLQQEKIAENVAPCGVLMTWATQSVVSREALTRGGKVESDSMALPDIFGNMCPAGDRYFSIALLWKNNLAGLSCDMKKYTIKTVKGMITAWRILSYGLRGSLAVKGLPTCFNMPIGL
jgi:hypothetical protein